MFREFETCIIVPNLVIENSSADDDRQNPAVLNVQPLGALYGAKLRRWVSLTRSSGWQQGLERTIRRIGSEPPVTGTNDLNFRKSRNVGRPSTAQQHEQTVRW